MLQSFNAKDKVEQTRVDVNQHKGLHGQTVQHREEVIKVGCQGADVATSSSCKFRPHVRLSCI